MGLFQSLEVGVAGLKSQASKLSVVSDNIANVNTTGYKGGIANFRTLVNEFTQSPFGPVYSPGGVAPGHQQTNQKAGIITPTGNSMDLAISGRGFFPVTATADGTAILYTRAGAFSKDGSGNYMNANGFFLKGWRLDVNGDLPTTLSGSNVAEAAAEAALETINLATLDLEPVPTSLITLQANLKSSESTLPNSAVTFVGNLQSSQTALTSTGVNVVTNLLSTQAAVSALLAYDPTDDAHNMASGAVPDDYTVPVTVYDGSGLARTLNISYLKTATDTWAVEIYAPTPADITPATGMPTGQLAAGNLTFNSDGTLASADAALTSAIDISWLSPVSASTVTFNFGTVDDDDGVKQSTTTYTGTATSRPDYDPSVAATSMSAGTVTPHYTTQFDVTDNTGVTHTVAVNFVKTAADTWGVELTAVPAADLTTATGGIDGQIAYGTVTFNSNGTLATISSSLTGAITVDWASDDEANSLQVDWGTIDQSNGLAQSTSAFSSAPTVVKNYDPLDDTKNIVSGSVSASFNRPIEVVDSGGNLRTLIFNFLKISNNNWAVEINAEDSAAVSTATAQIAHGTVTFNGDGTLAAISPSLSDPITVEWADGPSELSLNLGTVDLGDGLTQFNTNYRVDRAIQNGSIPGESAELSVDDHGIVSATYANGGVRRVYQIPLARFVSPDRLESISGNVFAQSTNSGGPIYFQPSQTEGTAIDSSALESSNVELSAELTDMLIAQRAYQSNSKLISTTDQMMDVLFKM